MPQTDAPGVGSYQAVDILSIASKDMHPLEGGAPNNFLLLSNGRKAAAFNCSSPRFRSPPEPMTGEEVGPGSYEKDAALDK